MNNVMLAYCCLGLAHWGVFYLLLMRIDPNMLPCQKSRAVEATALLSLIWPICVALTLAWITVRSIEEWKNFKAEEAKLKKKIALMKLESIENILIKCEAEPEMIEKLRAIRSSVENESDNEVYELIDGVYENIIGKIDLIVADTKQKETRC